MITSIDVNRNSPAPDGEECGRCPRTAGRGGRVVTVEQDGHRHPEVMCRPCYTRIAARLAILAYRPKEQP